MSKERFLGATLLITVTTLAVINQWVFIVVMIGLTIGGLYEFFYMVKKKGIPIYSYTGIFIGVMIPASIYTKFELTRNWELLFIILAFLLILILQFTRKDNTNAVVGFATTLFGVLYVSWFFSFLIKIRYLLPGMDGVKLLGFLILISKLGDIGALIIGSRWGRHPLFPRVSPNKSIEGSIGSMTFSVIGAILARSWLPDVPGFSILHVALLGAVFGSLGQLGDLCESLIKRDFNVKDSGKVLPSMGGVLDIIDSLLFTAPTFFLYMSATLNI